MEERLEAPLGLRAPGPGGGDTLQRQSSGERRAASGPPASPPEVEIARGDRFPMIRTESLEERRQPEREQTPPPGSGAGCASLSSEQMPWRRCSSPSVSVEFSARQLEQLHSVVRVAMREEIRAQRCKNESAGLPSQKAALFAECWGGQSTDGSRMDRRPSVERAPRAAATAPPAGLNPWGKAADEPVPAVEEWGVPTVHDTPKQKEDNPRRDHSRPPFEPMTTVSTATSRRTTLASVLRRDPSMQSLENSSAPWWQSRRVKRLVHGRYFDAIMGVVIMVNCVLIGLEVQLKLDDQDVAIFSWFDSIFLLWFLFEAIMRFVADGKIIFQSPWFRFDVVLVASGIAISWMVMPIVTTMGVQEVPLVSQLLTLRILRLLRTVRVFRMVSAFSELCRLCFGLLRSLRTMLSVGLLVFVALFSFAVLGVDLITASEKLNANDETRMIVESRFSSLPTFMLTLAQFATEDSLAAIYYPLCQEEPLLALYFCALWMVITVALMNLVTAVIVDSALSIGREEADLKQTINRKILQKNIPNLETLFELIDKDKNGTISFEEMQGMHESGQLIFPKDITSMIDPKHLVDMFEFVDTDKSGEVDRDEFIEGVCCLALSSMSIESLQMLQMLRECHRMLKGIQTPRPMVDV